MEKGAGFKGLEPAWWSCDKRSLTADLCSASFIRQVYYITLTDLKDTYAHCKETEGPFSTTRYH